MDIMAGFQILNAKDICTEYQYNNLDLPNIEATLYTKDGKVSFDSPWGRTEWHGEFVENGLGDVLIKFAYRGTKPYHKVKLRNAGPWLYIGRDYLHRRFELTEVRKTRWDAHTKRRYAFPPMAFEDLD